MNELLLEKFNRIEKTHWWWEGRRALLSLLIPNRKTQRILDVGCGTGETLSFLKRKFPKSRLYGVDNSAQAVKYSRSRGHENIYKANAQQLPFKDNYFDSILFLDVLEHIKDHQKAINEAKRVLKKRGKIIITSPGLSFIWSHFDENQGHERRYTRKDIRRLAYKANLKVEFISYFNFFLSPPIIAIRLLGRIKPLSYLSDYDRGFNFEIAFKPVINNILKRIFVFEITLLQFIKYPIGVSIASVFCKE